MKKIPQDIVGEIAILKFPKNTLWIIKKLKARKFLKNHKSVKTVVEKTLKFSGKLRIPKNKYLAGEKTFITRYRENDCLFYFDINKTYFSPRLSNERKLISDDVLKLIKNNSQILVCFSGIAPYPITIAKKMKRLKRLKKNIKIIAVELNKDACHFARKNIIINKVQDIVGIINLDVKNLSKKLKKKKFDIILMPRPNLKETFLKEIMKHSKKGTTFFYHGFGEEKEKVLNEIKKDTKNKISKINIRKAGNIAPYKFRWQAKFKVLTK